VDIQQLSHTAEELVTPGKGILAADESSGTIKKRFDSIDVESTEENRRNYRELLFRTPGVGEYISGIILYDETLRQKSANGTPLVKVIQDQGVIPGIKVDTGGKPLAGSSGEQVTEGLDGLRDRLAEYVELGARFTKWRGIYSIGRGLPSRYCIEANAHALARFAALSQEVGLVPIIEPEVLMDGDHNIRECFDATETTLREVYYQLGHQRVNLEGTLLKPNMILSGKDALNRAGPEEVAEKTVACLKRTVPASVPGMVFLSGGQSDDEATMNLNSINQHAASVGVPWQLSFSYGRGLQAAPLKIWRGDADNVEQTQKMFHQRAYVTGMARQGKYSPGIEGEQA
jgi:fructose-bisphosphate aldolase class I